MILNYYISILADKEISICNKPIILYRGDCNVELQFEFRQFNDIVNDIGAAYAQVLIHMPDGDIINITKVSPITDGKVIATIIAQYIDETLEIGDYDFQIRLFDSEMVARLTIPPVLKGLRVREPIVSDSNVDVTRVDEAYLLAVAEPEETFIEDSYNKTTWELGDIITSPRMNKIEDGIYQVNEKVNTKADADYISENYALKSEIPTNVSQLTNDAKYVTEEQSENFALKSEIPSLEDYATKDYVGGKIAEAQLGSGTGGDGNVNIDLSVYALKSDIPKKVSQLTNDKGYLTEHQSLEGYATEDYVDSKIEEAQLNSGNDIDLSEYAKKTDIPSLEGYATEDYVSTKIAEAQLNSGSGEDINLSEYAKKSEIPTSVSQLINDAGYLTQHQSLENYASKSYVENRLTNVITSSEITRIEIVNALPDTEEPGVLYIVKE